MKVYRTIIIKLYCGLILVSQGAPLEAAGPPTPVIITQPQDQTVTQPQTATFSIVATISPSSFSLGYQWQRNGTTIPGATSPSYTTPPSRPTDNGARFSCTVTNTGTFVTPQPSVTSSEAVLTVLPGLRVYPNPWRVDRHAGSPITFDRMALNSVVKIFTVPGHWVKTLKADSNGMATWDLTNDAGEKVASGYYLYLINTDNPALKVHGKLAIIQ